MNVAFEEVLLADTPLYWKSVINWMPQTDRIHHNIRIETVIKLNF